MWYRLCHVINSLPNLNCPYFLHAFLWRYCNNKVLLSVVKHGPRELSFLLLLLLLGCFDFIFTQNHLLWRQKYKALGGKTAALIARGHKFNPSTTVNNTRSGGTPVIATLGSRDKNFLGLHWIGFVPFHIPAIAFVWVNLWNLCSTHLMSVALVNATLSSTQQTAEARWWGLHVCSFQKNFSLVMESCWGINTLWRCSHEKVFHAPIQSTHKSRLSEFKA